MIAGGRSHVVPPLIFEISGHVSFPNWPKLMMEVYCYEEDGWIGTLVYHPSIIPHPLLNYAHSCLCQPDGMCEGCALVIVYHTSAAVTIVHLVWARALSRLSELSARDPSAK